MNRKEEIKDRLKPKKPVRVFSYIHGDGRIGVLLEIQSDTDFGLRTDRVEDFAHEVCLQIASMAPLVLSTCQSIILTDAREMAKMAITVETQEEKPALKDKPDLLEKIVNGKMAKWDKENVLLCQPWVKDNKQTIGDLLKDLQKCLGEDTKILRFARFGS